MICAAILLGPKFSVHGTPACWSVGRGCAQLLPRHGGAGSFCQGRVFLKHRRDNLNLELLVAEDMQQDAIDCAAQAMEKYNIEKDIAAYIKKEFDKKYNPTWHCIVGRNFGSYVTHETKHFIYFYLGQVAILLFKSG
jgi:dynein light chain LC8-type